RTHTDQCVTRLGQSRRSGAVNAACGEAGSKICTTLIERHTLTVLVIRLTWRRLSHREVKLVVYSPHAPPLRNLAKLRVHEAGRKEVGEGLGESDVAAFGLGADGVEIDEPRLEQRQRHRFQCLVHTSVQLNLVVQRAEDVGDG